MASNSKRVLIFGATGRIGQMLVTKCLEAGHQVTGVTRNPEAAMKKQPRIRWIKADALDPKTYEDALVGQDVVFGCTGSDGIKEKTVIFSQGYARIIEAMERKGVSRLIAITSSHDHPQAGCFFRRVVKPCILNNIYADIEVLETWLRDKYRGSVNFTILRPFEFKKGKGGKYVMVESYTAESTGWSYKSIDVDVADAMYEVFKQSLYSNKFVDVGNKRS